MYLFLNVLFSFLAFSQNLPPSTSISATTPEVSSVDIISKSRSVSLVNHTLSNCDSLPSTDKNKVENWLMLSANYLSLPTESKSELKIGNSSSSANTCNVGLTQSQNFKPGVVMKQVNANSQVQQERGTSEPSFQELHKAARQALAVNQIQTKLQTHLKEKQTAGSPGVVLPSEVLKRVSVANQSNGPLQKNMAPGVFNFKVNGFVNVSKPNTITKFSEETDSSLNAPSRMQNSAAITHNKAKMNLETQVVHNILLPNPGSSSGMHNSISKHSKIVFKDGSDVKSHITLSRSITVGSSMTLTDKPSGNNNLQINKIHITSAVPLVSHAIQGIQTASKIAVPPVKYVLQQGIDAKGQKVHYLIPASAFLIGNQQGYVSDQPKKNSELHQDNVKGTFKTQTKQIMDPNHGATFLSKKMTVETSIVGNIQSRPLLNNFHQYPPYSCNNPSQGNCSSGNIEKITDTKSHFVIKRLDIGTTESSLSVVSTVTPKVSTVLVTNTLNVKTPGAKNVLVSPMRLLNQGTNFAKSMNPTTALPSQSENKHSVHSSANHTLKMEVNNQLQTAQNQTALSMSNHISKPSYKTDPSSLQLPGAAGRKGVVLNQAQLLQYHRDGKILVTSSGELLLMTSNQ